MIPFLIKNHLKIPIFHNPIHNKKMPTTQITNSSIGLDDKMLENPPITPDTTLPKDLDRFSINDVTFYDTVVFISPNAKNSLTSLSLTFCT